MLRRQLRSAAISRRELLVLFVTALCAITICSKSSPLYPMNDWVDANCFFTVGRSMLSGKVLYRDIFEQSVNFIGAPDCDITKSRARNNAALQRVYQT